MGDASPCAGSLAVSAHGSMVALDDTAVELSVSQVREARNAVVELARRLGDADDLLTVYSSAGSSGNGLLASLQEQLGPCRSLCTVALGVLSQRGDSPCRHRPHAESTATLLGGDASSAVQSLAQQVAALVEERDSLSKQLHEHRSTVSFAEDIASLESQTKEALQQVVQRSGPDPIDWYQKRCEVLMQQRETLLQALADRGFEDSQQTTPGLTTPSRPPRPDQASPLPRSGTPLWTQGQHSVTVVRPPSFSGPSVTVVTPPPVRRSTSMPRSVLGQAPVRSRIVTQPATPGPTHRGVQPGRSPVPARRLEVRATVSPGSWLRPGGYAGPVRSSSAVAIRPNSAKSSDGRSVLRPATDRRGPV